jgi:electron transfer flavoprotein alpha subunit
MSVLAVIEHDRGTIASASLGVLTAARNLATQMGTSLEAVTVGANADALASVAAQYGATAFTKHTTQHSPTLVQKHGAKQLHKLFERFHHK